MPLNWCFEWLKWKEVVRFSGDKPTIQQRYHSFWAGIVSGMLTPNMLGNFLGRIYYFKRTVRFIITYLTLLGSFSQFLITILSKILSNNELSNIIIPNSKIYG